jgi:hypothetical protein
LILSLGKLDWIKVRLSEHELLEVQTSAKAHLSRHGQVEMCLSGAVEKAQSVTIGGCASSIQKLSTILWWTRLLATQSEQPDSEFVKVDLIWGYIRIPESAKMLPETRQHIQSLPPVIELSINICPHLLKNRPKTQRFFF